MISVTKQFSFCYGHRLPDYDGKCCVQHGHNSILEVEVSGPAKNQAVPKGMVTDFGDLKGIVNLKIIDVLDHANINDLSPTGSGDQRAAFIRMINMPTAENMTAWIVSVLSLWFGVNLMRVRLSETPTSWAEWKN